MFSFGIFERRRKKRESMRNFSMMMYVLEEMADGKRVEDIVMYHIPNPVEWDQAAQKWTVKFAVPLGEGQWVLLQSGRGGMEEEANLYGAKYVPELDTYVYEIRFQTKTKTKGEDVK
jgi:hypothetical protein